MREKQVPTYSTSMYLGIWSCQIGKVMIGAPVVKLKFNIISYVCTPTIDCNNYFYLLYVLKSTFPFLIVKRKNFFIYPKNLFFKVQGKSLSKLPKF
jgi:hypothetical protein